MSTNRPVIPGETIPLEQFPAHLKQRARLLSAMVLKIESKSTYDIEQILSASDENLRKVQLGDKLTYEELDEYLLRKVFWR
ncbi:MAG: hypothetical protein ABIR46_00390 [Candidatus Saccharimonadales bacterium]